MRRYWLERWLPHRFGACPIAAVIALGVCGLLASPAMAQDKDGAGLIIGKASSENVGLPIYPGAIPHRDPGNDSDSARLSLWGGGHGFEVAAKTMESNDAPAHVADFYKKALAKYGKVLDCTQNAADAGAKTDSRNALTCAHDQPKQGGMLFKAGTEKKQHIVAIEPNGSGTVFHLVYVWVDSD